MLYKIRLDFDRYISEFDDSHLVIIDGKKEYIPKSIIHLLKKKRKFAIVPRWYFEKKTDITIENIEETKFISIGGSILNSHKAEKCSVIESKVFPLRKKQRELVNHFISSRFIAWLCDAGTGKTICTTTIAYSRWKAGLVSNTFIMCPAHLKTQWEKLILSYYPDFSDFHIVSIDSTSTDNGLEKTLKKFNDLDGEIQLIIDESQYLKNNSANRSRNLEKNFNAEYVQIATAFPIERSAGDLFYQFGVMSREIIGCENYGQYEQNFLILGGNDGERIVAYKNTEQLKERISPYIARMEFKEVNSDIPPVAERYVYFDLNKEQKEAIGAIENLIVQMQTKTGWLPENKKYMIDTFLHKICSGYVPTQEEINTTFKDFGKLGESADNIRKIGQIAYNPYNNRIKALKEQLEILRNKQVIIWCKYIDEIKTIHSEIGNSIVIDGSVTGKKRDQAEDDFKSGKYQYLIISIGINSGLNFNNCHKTIFFSQDYSRTKRENAKLRIQRADQIKPCEAIFIVANNSLDVRIFENAKHKNKICNIFEK